MTKHDVTDKKPSSESLGAATANAVRGWQIDDQNIQPGAGQLEYRPADQVMRLARIGSFHQSRLSFMRVLLRRLKREQWRFERPVWRIDENGVGVATYAAVGPKRTYTLIAFARDLPDDLRSDRVIAEAWDSTFTLYDGVPDEDDLERLAKEVPVQEAGRLSESELILSRANRSVRLFNHVRECLAAGRQPSVDAIESVGYLMRTTAVYGSGKFGAADREQWAERPEFAGSFQPELLSVWLIRTFTVELVEHMAKARSPRTACSLDAALSRRLGVGNSTGLGMAPFLMNHPALLHSWIHARETALARVRLNSTGNTQAATRFRHLLQRAWVNAKSWQVEHAGQSQKIMGLLNDFELLDRYLDTWPAAAVSAPAVAESGLNWDELYRWCEANLSLEGQEQVVSLMIDAHAELVDDLADTLCADEKKFYRIKTTGSINELLQQIETLYSWALEQDFNQPETIARVWYVSAEKLEPRLGERFEEDIEPYEQPLAPARDVAILHQALQQQVQLQPGQSVASFLMQHPEHRYAVRRVHIISQCRYAEIRDNTIAADMQPIDLLRCKLSFFGATRFDPRSDRWLRITMYQGSPYPQELADTDPDDCAYPALPVTTPSAGQTEHAR